MRSLSFGERDPQRMCGVLSRLGHLSALGVHEALQSKACTN